MKSGLWLALASSTDPVIPWCSKVLVDGSVSQLSVVLVPAVVLLALIGKCVATCCSVRSVGQLSATLMGEFQAPLLARLFNLDTHADNGSHRVIDLLTFEMRHLTEFIDRFTSRFIKNLCSLLFLIGSLAWIAPRHALVTILALIPFTLILFTLGRYAWRIGMSQQLESQRLIGRVSESLDSSLQYSQLSEALAARSFKGIRRLAIRYYDVNALSPNFTQALVALLFGLIILYASRSFQHGDLNKGEFVAFVTNLLMLMAPLKYIAELCAPIGRGMANIYLLLAQMRELSEVRGERLNVPLRIQLVDLQYAIPFSNRSLSAGPILLGPGEHVAVSGASGEGKSTLLEIMIGHRQPTSGCVLLSGKHLSHARLDPAKVQFMYLRQGCELIHAAQLASLSLFASTAEAASARLSLALFGLHDLARALAEPLDQQVVLERCSTLTRAEQQRLMMAEAHFSDHASYFIDEPLAALERAERTTLIGEFLKAKQGATVVFSAHAVPEQFELDAILQIENGRVIARRRLDGCSKNRLSPAC